jgi:ABC-type branched-subunit amino acid transport system ATPase component
VSPVQFPPDLSIGLIAIPVIGGLGSLGGAVLAAVLLYSMTFFIGPKVAPIFGNFGQNLAFSLFLAGFGLIAVQLSLPTGLAGAIQRGWQRYLVRWAMRVDPAASEDPGSLLGSETVAIDETPPVAAAAITTAAAAPSAEAVPFPELAEVLAAPAPLKACDEDAIPALAISGVKVHFGGVVALNEPGITVWAGEVVGLIGTNGAGKTTLMNVISGMQRPDQGSVRVFGHEVVDLGPDFRASYGVARSFQDARLFAGLSVTETVQVALARQHKVGMVSALVAAPWVRVNERRVRREADAIVRRFGLAPWADVRTSDLSTGTRRICDLAAQVAARPKLLLLDEPTAGVAQREAEAFGPLLRGIREELDCAILIVEHDMPLLMGLCDRVYALETGAVIAEGTPEQIRHDPKVVTSYLGTTDVAISRSGAAATSTGGAG